MATNNVFGRPITEGSTRTERAIQALNNPNENGKRGEALAYVRRLKDNWGNGRCALAIFYNATGETMLFTQANSSQGHIHDSYPNRVQNGQWGAFFHVKNPVVAQGSVGFVVYRVRTTDTIFHNPLVAWESPWGLRWTNQSFCEVYDDGRVDPPNEVYKKMNSLNSRQCVAISKGLVVSTTLEDNASPLFEAQFTREDAAAARRESADQQDVEASPTTDQDDVAEASPST